MGRRRRIRSLGRIVFIILITTQPLIGGFQIKTIPENSFFLATNKGMSATKFKLYKKNTIDINFLKFPQTINFLKLTYNEFSFAFLDYGILTNQINNQIIDKFHAYEADFQYSFHKPIMNKFLLNANIGISYSKIGFVDAYALTSKIKATTSILKKNTNLAILINNLGIVIDDYTNIKTELPLELQFGITHKIYKTNILLAYDLIYQPIILDKKHIINIQFPIGKIIKLNFSSSNYQKKLSFPNNQNDLFYGLGLGLSIKSESINTSIGVNSLGAAGFSYGISFKKNILN